MGARIGIDIGGTFTDLVLVDDRSGAAIIDKILTVPGDPGEAVETGIMHLLEASGLAIGSIELLVHATTLVTNALIERKGAALGLLTTRGFRDTLEIAREGRYDMYDAFIERPDPLVPRAWRVEVDERILADGTLAVPLDDKGARAAIEALLAQGITSLAVALVNAHVDGRHERRLEALARQIAPDLFVSCSSSVVPEIREYERTSTAAANAYVQPVVHRYVLDLERRLGAVGFCGRLLFMLSSGGLCTPDTAKRFPVRLVESGPAAGAAGAAALGEAGGRERLLSFDMGGTTAKVCVIDKGEPLVAREFEVARAERFKKGSGLPLLVPSVELIEIGAGGGSIARIGGMNLPKVGPDSSGAVPGPACYGRGGTAPTVTDADLVLGYLDPDFFLGGRMRLDRRKAIEAIERTIARPLGLDLTQAAWGIHRVVNENMAAAARAHAIERGKDLQRYMLLAFGGAGPVHAWDLARILRIERVIVPPMAGALSAAGLLGAPIAFDFVRSSTQPLLSADWALVERLLDEMEREARTLLAAAGIEDGAMTMRRRADIRFVGQGHEVLVELPPGRLSAARLPELVATFERTYQEIYRHVPDGLALEALNWRIVASGPKPRRAVAPATRGAAEDGSARKRTRSVFFGDAGWVEATVLDRYRMAPGDRASGPAIIEERESTTVIGPSSVVRVTPDGDLLIEMRG